MGKSRGLLPKAELKSGCSGGMLLNVIDWFDGMLGVYAAMIAMAVMNVVCCVRLV